MGFSCSCVLVRGLDRAEVVQRLGVQETSRQVEWGGSRLALGDVGNGWFVVQSLDFNYPTAQILAAVSQGAEALSCQIEEHVMVSIARNFRDGRQIWSATHNPEEGIDSLTVEGDPPAELTVIRDRLRAEQDAEGDDAGVDCMFDAAPEIVELLAGYRHDRDIPFLFTVLQPLKGPGFFQRLFGKR